MVNNKIRIYVRPSGVKWDKDSPLTSELYRKMFVHPVPMCPKIPPRVAPSFQSWRSRQMQSWEKCSNASKFDCSWRDKRSKCICNIKIMYFIEKKETHIGHICLNISLVTGDTKNHNSLTQLPEGIFSQIFPFWEVLNWPLETWLSKFFLKFCTTLDT